MGPRKLEIAKPPYLGAAMSLGIAFWPSFAPTVAAARVAASKHTGNECSRLRT